MMHDVPRRRLRRRLAQARPPEQGAAAGPSIPGAMMRLAENRLDLMVDPIQCRSFDDGTVTACRAIDRRGDLLWVVWHPDHPHGYPSRREHAASAVAEATQAWKRRRAIRHDWTHVKALARDLRWGRTAFDVTREDAAEAPLADAGIDAFLAHLGLGGARRVPGWFLAWLMPFEPRIGYVLHTAERRTATAGEPDPTPV
ncbi:hypothetical protein [Jannaschia sp. LMIT008]|uniref:hypothetical protein n=1 Tax=Jannaschia maritima TaxID=3032585 RepID=UPI002810F1CA|nr:hypothetical protein [Jannaschia sp. LMIT008]